MSTLTKKVDMDVKLWSNRDLSNLSYPYLLADVIYIKVRENHRVISKTCHIAILIKEEGKREIIGFKISEAESEETWSLFFEHLKERGLTALKMVISDAHKGLVKSIKETFINT